MKILNTRQIAEAKAGGQTFLTLQKREVRAEGGKEFAYFICARGSEVPPPEEKKPEAVMVVAIVDNPDEELRILVTSEFRIPIGCREISFPAGLIDAEDYEKAGGTIRGAALRAAIREVKEETGLDFTPTAVSPNNLYSSAGMTNESIFVVFGYARGVPNTEGNEASEDIEVILLTFRDMVEMLDTRNDLAYSKAAWPFMWAFKFFGGFTKGI